MAVPWRRPVEASRSRQPRWLDARNCPACAQCTRCRNAFSVACIAHVQRGWPDVRWPHARVRDEERSGPPAGTRQEVAMMPDPTTMRFAWDDEVLRCAEVLVSMFVLALVLLVGGAILTGQAQDI